MPRRSIWIEEPLPVSQFAEVQMLRRGIPYVSVFGWDRRRSRAGCAAPRPKAPPGFYVLQAEGSGIKTKKTRFELLAKDH